MKIKKNDLLTLNDNRKYLVVSRVIFNDNIYLYLVDIEINTNTKAMVVNPQKDTLIEIDQTALDQKLLLLLLKDAMESLKEGEE